MIGHAKRLAPGTLVVQVRLNPVGAHTAWVMNGFMPWVMAYGHHTNDHMYTLGSATPGPSLPLPSPIYA